MPSELRRLEAIVHGSLVPQVSSPSVMNNTNFRRQPHSGSWAAAVLFQLETLGLQLEQPVEYQVWKAFIELPIGVEPFEISGLALSFLRRRNDSVPMGRSLK